MKIANNPKTLLNLIGGRQLRLALGNFDGVHVGHRVLISQLINRCRAQSESSIVVTFQPHPSLFFGRNPEFRKIDTPEIQRRLLAELGVDGLLELQFDSALAGLSGVEFIENILGVLPIREIAVGADFRFGHDRKGDVELLTAEGRKRRFTVSVMDPVQVDGSIASSSRVRSLISDLGDVEAAAKVLGRSFCLVGRVVHGNKLGRKIGFPTANLSEIQQVLPKAGVYSGSLRVIQSASNDGLSFEDLRSVVNIGFRPTVDGAAGLKSVEAHVFEQGQSNLDLYGAVVELSFHKRLRDEMKFENIESLKAQIALDIEDARKT